MYCTWTYNADRGLLLESSPSLRFELRLKKLYIYIASRFYLSLFKILAMGPTIKNPTPTCSTYLKSTHPLFIHGHPNWIAPYHWTCTNVIIYWNLCSILDVINPMLVLNVKENSVFRYLFIYSWLYDMSCLNLQSEHNIRILKKLETAYLMYTLPFGRCILYSSVRAWILWIKIWISVKIGSN